MTFLTFIILAFAVYRITHLIVFDKIFEPVRKHFVTRGFDGTNLTYTLQGGAVRQFFGKIMNCYWCAGIWVSAVVIGGYLLSSTISYYVCLIFALSSVQALIETKWLKAVGLPLEMKEVPAELEEDELSAARGIIYGIIFSLVLWVALVGGCLLVILWHMAAR